MDPIQDREIETLVSTDAAIIKVRNLLHAAAKNSCERGVAARA